MLTRFALITVAVCCYSASAEDLAEEVADAAIRAQISIIIDDLGYQLDQGKALARLPHRFTIAIIPFTPYGSDIARYAYQNKKEIMLHAPMEPLGTSKWEAGLTAKMGEQELIRTMSSMLKDIPHAVGINNHGGSKLTQDRGRMQWIMQFLARKQLYFVDSRTIANTTASNAASHAAVRNSSRDVFLDNDKSPDLIKVQLNKLRQIATKRGYAIGIAHPYPETISTLVEELPKLYRQGILLVDASRLLYQKSPENSTFFAVKYDTKDTIFATQ